MELLDKKRPTSLSVCGVNVMLGRFSREEAQLAREGARAHARALFGADYRKHRSLPEDFDGLKAGLRNAAICAVNAVNAAAPELQRRASAFSGLRWMAARGQWRARCWHEGKEVTVGYFADEAAAKAAVEASMALGGEGAAALQGGMEPSGDVLWHRGRWLARLLKGRLRYFDSREDAVAAVALAHAGKRQERKRADPAAEGEGEGAV